MFLSGRFRLKTLNQSVYGGEKFFMKRSIALGIASVLLIAGGTAAASFAVSNMIEVDATVEEGLNYHSEKLTVGSQEFTDLSSATINSGDSFDLDANLANDANTGSPDTVEIVTISGDQDLTAGDVQRVQFTAESLSGPTQGNTVDEVIEFSSGSYDSVNGYLGVAESNGDILACVGDDSMTFASGEEWEKTFSIDTSHNMDASSLDVDLELVSLNKYDGSQNPAVSGCPQY